MSTLTCPKCQGQMRSYERNGVTVDQCAECRGIFLDRGELEHLVEADSRAHAATTPPPSAPPPRQEEPRRETRYRDDDYDDDRHEHRYRSEHGSSGHGSKRRKHWVEDLFG